MADCCINIYMLHLLASTDSNLHSANPYTPAMLNPVTDHFMKATLTHQLHHAVLNDYYVIYPLHHFYKTQRDSDVTRYNHMLKTNVCFDWFIADTAAAKPAVETRKLK